MNTKLLIILAVEIVVIVLIACVIVYLCTKNDDDDEGETGEHKGPQSVQNAALNLEKMPKIPANQEPVPAKEQAKTEDNWDYDVDDKADFDHNEEG